MNTAAIYFSPTGTSAKGTKAIAKVLQVDAEDIDITLENTQEKREFSENDIVVFGAPVYSGRIFSGIKKRLSEIKGNNTPCVVTVTYGNRDYDDALLELSDIVKENGFIPIAGAALIGEHTYGKIQVGRPNDEDIKEDENFAQKILGKLNSETANQINLPGNKDYKKNKGSDGGSFRPLTDEKCVECGLCAAQCPQNAIDKYDFSKIDNDKCIACFRCIHICPVHAKNMNTPEYNKFAEEFSKKLSQPRSNQYFA